MKWCTCHQRIFAFLAILIVVLVPICIGDSDTKNDVEAKTLNGEQSLSKGAILMILDDDSSENVPTRKTSKRRGGKKVKVGVIRLVDSEGNFVYR